MSPVRSSGSRRRLIAVVALGLGAVLAGCSSSGSGSAGSTATTQSPAQADLRINQLQVLGMHNAYHVEPTPEDLAKYIAVSADAATLAYSHDSLDKQFQNEGIRQVELDITQDPTGQKFRPKGVVGSKVFHIEGIDEGSTCLTLVECLTVVKTWSDAHQDAIPIGIQLEIKDNNPLTPAQFDSVDAEIRSVFPPERLITPDDVRGTAPTLEQAVLTTGWPRLDDSRGKVMFVLDNREDEYTAGGHPSLEGRVAFPPSTPGKPDAAFLKENDPTGGEPGPHPGRGAQGLHDPHPRRHRGDHPHQRRHDATGGGAGQRGAVGVHRLPAPGDGGPLQRLDLRCSDPRGDAGSLQPDQRPGGM